MNKSILNAVGWTLVTAAMLFAFGGVPGISPGVSATITAVLALTAVPIFWFGGCNGSRCKRLPSTD